LCAASTTGAIHPSSNHLHPSIHPTSQQLAHNNNITTNNKNKNKSQPPPIQPQVNDAIMMNSTSSGEDCPEWDPEWPVDDWPELNQTLGLSVYLLHTSVLLGSVLFMWMRRHHAPYRNRNPVLLAVYAFGLNLFAFNMSLREYIGRDKFPCVASLFLNYTSAALWMGPFAGESVIQSFHTLHCPLELVCQFLKPMRTIISTT
jgi:hypothetical protein